MGIGEPKHAGEERDERHFTQAEEEYAGLRALIGLSGEEVRDAMVTTTMELLRQPLHLVKHTAAYGIKLTEVASGKSKIAASLRDRRFADEAWKSSSPYKGILQAYLALTETMDEWLADLDLDKQEEQRVRFILTLLGDSISPSNNLLTNPAAMKKLRETGGGSLLQGFRHLLDDIVNNHGMPTQVDKDEFDVGKNLATTEGAVVFRNEILELIQYKPRTRSTYRRPLVIVPPQINKYYIFDLTPEKSLFRYLLDQGFRLFAVSWRNPSPENAHWGLDDYVFALEEAVAAVKSITREESINLVGSCAGGITASVFTGYLGGEDGNAVNSLSLNVCVLSPTPADNEITAIASDRAIEAARRKSRSSGVLDGAELSRVFSWMRPNDLIWCYVVNNYLLGNKPPTFDIFYWNNDTTCLTAQLHSDFLDIVLSDPLATPGDLTVGDRPIDLSTPNCDKYLVAGVTDHITPWQACYRNVDILGGDIRFVLSSGGHIQSLVNPPENARSTYYINDDLPRNHEEWMTGATQYQGSWWADWSVWLRDRSGRKVRSRLALGSREYPPLEAAPGSYVKD